MTDKSTLEKLKENEREIRRDLMISAALNLFAQKPYNQVSMRDIAAEAGISPASIYRYFRDKDELFVETFFRKGKAIGASLERLLAESRDASLETLAANFVQYLLDNDSFFQMMTHFMIDGGINEQAIERFNETERYLLSIFDQVFINLGAKENVRMISHAFFASLNGILITFRKYPGRNQEEINRHVLRLANIAAGIFSTGIKNT